MVKNKNLTIVAYLVLLLFAIVTLSYRETGAKYHKAEMNMLNYGAKFKKMTGELTGRIDDNKETGSNYETLKYIIEFAKSNNMNDDDTKDTYDIQLNNEYCSIISLDTEGATPASISDDNTQIVYQRQEDNSGKINAVVSCNVLQIKKQNSKEFELSINIKEKFNEETFDYLYIEHKNKIDFAEYDKQFPNPLPSDVIVSDNEIKIPIAHAGTKVYTELIDWLKQHVRGVTNDDTYVTSYLHSYSSIANIISITRSNITKFKEVDGFTEATYDDDYYIFKIDNKFANYVMTSGNVNFSKKQFYFYNIDDSDVDSLFEYYVKKYIYPNDSQKVSEIMSQIGLYENTSLSNIIKLSQVRDLGIDYLDSCLIVPEDLYDILSSYSKKVIIKDIIDQNDMNEKFQLLFVNENTKDEILDYLNEQYDNFDGEQYESHNIFLDNDKNILVHIYFEEGANDIVPHVEVESLEKAQQTLIFNLRPFIGEDYDGKERFKQELNNIVNTLYNGEYQIIGDSDIQDLFTTLTPGEYQITIGIDGSGTITIALNDQAGYTVTLNVESISTFSETVVEQPDNEPEVSDVPSNE